LDQISRTHDERAQTLQARFDERHSAWDQRLDKLAQDARTHDERAKMLQARFDERHSALDQRLDQISRTHDDRAQTLLARADERHSALDQRLDRLAQEARAHGDRTQMLQSRADERHSALDQRLDQISRMHEDRTQKSLGMMHSVLDQRLDELTQTHKEHADGMHRRLAELGRLHSGTQSDVRVWEQRLGTLSDRFDGVKHVDTGLKALGDHVEALKRANGDSHDSHKKTMSDMEAKLRADLQQLVESQDRKHAELKSALQNVHDAHLEKHTQNAAALEDGIAGALKNTHSKLEEEMRILRDEHGGNHGSLRDVLREVTKQVDSIDQILQKEQKARLAVEERLDKSCNELRRDMSDSLREHGEHRVSHTRLQELLKRNGLEHTERLSAFSEQVSKRFQDIDINGPLHAALEQTTQAWQQRLQECFQSRCTLDEGRHIELHSRVEKLEKAHDQNMDVIRVRIEELSVQPPLKESMDWEERFGALASYLKCEIARVEAAIKTGQGYREALDQLAGQVGALNDGLSAEKHSRDGLAQIVDRLLKEKAHQDSKWQVVERHLQKLSVSEMQLLREMRRDNDNMAQEIKRAVFCHPAEEAGGAAMPALALPASASSRRPAAVLHMAQPQVSNQAQPDQITFAASVPIELVPKQDGVLCRICGSKFLADETACLKCGSKRPLLEGSPGMIRSLRNPGESETSNLFR